MSRRAFTILEVLLSLALIALFATILVGSSARLLQDKAATPNEVFWKACQAARKSALKSNGDVRLTYDDKARAFVVSSGPEARPFPIPRADRDLEVSFLTAQAGGSSILLGGTLVETQTQPYVTFYADGTCSPFRMQVHQGSHVDVISIDPWTCAEVLPKPAE